MQSRPPQIREDFSEVQALKRCIRRRNSQVALILAVVLISLSACLMPQTSRDRFVGNNGSIQKNEYGQQKTSEWLFRESTLDAPFSFRSRLGRRYQGGGLMGKPVIDTHRGDSVFRRDRAGKVLAYRGGAAGDAAGANSSNARTSGRGRAVFGDETDDFDVSEELLDPETRMLYERVRQDPRVKELHREAIKAMASASTAATNTSRPLLQKRLKKGREKMRRPQESGLFNTGDVTDITGSLYSGDDDNAVLSSNADITDNTDRLLYGNSKSRTFNALRTQLAQSERKLNMSGDSATNSTHKPRPRRSSSPRIVDKREKRHTSGTRSFTGSDSDESSNVLTDEGLTDWTGDSETVVDFEFFDPNKTLDLNNVATLLEQYATAGWPNSETGVGVSFDYMNMATAIINQSEFNFESGVGRVGTVIKGMSDWKAENGSSATGLVGFVSMVNLIRYKNTLWARQLREYFLAATEGIQDADLKSHNLGGRLRLKRALNSDRALLLILERSMMELPPQLTYSALEAVCEEVDYAREDETDGQIKRFWNYDTIIYLTHAKSTYKKAVNARKKRRHADRKAEKNHEHTEDGSGGIGEGDLGQPTALGCVGPADIYHSFPEERCLHSASIFSSIFQTKQQKEQAEGEVRLLLVLTREGLSKARAEMRKISEEEDKKAQERVRARADRAATGQPRTPRRNLKIPW